MSRWRWRVTLRVRRAVREHRVWFTQKAARELEESVLRLDHADALDILAGLTPEDAFQAFASEVTGECLYVYRIRVSGVPLYIKLALRGRCDVISFHDDEGPADDEEVETD